MNYLKQSVALTSHPSDPEIIQICHRCSFETQNDQEWFQHLKSPEHVLRRQHMLPPGNVLHRHKQHNNKQH